MIQLNEYFIKITRLKMHLYCLYRLIFSPSKLLFPFIDVNITSNQSLEWKERQDNLLKIDFFCFLTNVIMLKVLEQRDFPDRSTRCPFFVLQSNLFQSNKIIRQARFALENRCISTLQNGNAKGKLHESTI